jgi:hypothetical protein
MNDTKDWYASTGVWGGILAAGAPLLGTMLHQEIPSDLVTQLAALFAAVGGVIAIIGRMRATTMIQSSKKG